MPNFCCKALNCSELIVVPAEVSKEDAIIAGKEALGDKLAGTVVKEIYVPGKIINIVVKPN